MELTQGDELARELAQRITAGFQDLPQVVAIAWGGSRASGMRDAFSDLDFYFYVQETIPVKVRENIAAKFAPVAEINNQYWETGDEWIDQTSGLGVDIMYRDPRWVEGELERVLVSHQAYVGYSTCIWYNVRNSQPLYDPTGWYATLQQTANQPYPQKLRQAVIAKNYPLLRNTQTSYYRQIEKALLRQDLVSYNHRLAAFLASYFDVIFAFNSQPHPGEKRLIAQVQKLCERVPQNFEANLTALLNLPPTSENVTTILEQLNGLVDELDKMLG